MGNVIVALVCWFFTAVFSAGLYTFIRMIIDGALAGDWIVMIAGGILLYVIGGALLGCAIVSLILGLIAIAA